MTAFLVGLGTGLVVGFVVGGVFMVVQERRMEAKFRRGFRQGQPPDGGWWGGGR